MQFSEFYFPVSNPTIDPVFCGHEDCEPDHSWGPGVRLYWLIHFVESGKGIFHLKGKEYPVSAGSFFVVPPDEEVMYQADHNDPWNYMWVGFHCTGSMPIELSPVMFCPEAGSVFRSMLECEHLSGGSKAYLTGRIWDFFSLLLEQTHPAADAVDQALNYIHSKYMYPLSVESIAARVNLERSYFTTLFTARVGVSPGKYLQNHRMHIAASLLTQGHRSVSTTALSVGYPDIYTFSKTFKRHFGVSPREFSKQNK